jgi:phosphate-selective porin OprO and OprP
MRKLLLVAAAGVLPLQAEALNLEGLGAVQNEKPTANIYYDNGTHLDFGTRFTSKWNLGIVANYAYEDLDGRTDSNDAAIDRARLEITGTLMDGQFSYAFSNDFSGDTEFLNNSDDNTNRDLRDAWLQYNWCEDLNLRAGQFVVNYSRQANVNYFHQQMLDRSVVTQYFAPGRNVGVMLLGSDSDGLNYSVSIYEGESKGDGINFDNLSGADTNFGGAGQISYDFGNYGSRAYEGDYMTTEDFAATIGLNASFQQDKVTVAPGASALPFVQILPTNNLSKLNRTRVGGDVGIRSEGFSLQSEINYENIDFDEGNNESTDTYGYYAQAGYFFVPSEWEIAARFGRIDFDDTSAIDNLSEYGAALGYYFDGHNMKIQTGPTWSDYTYGSGSDVTDFRYEVRLTGYL